MKRLVGLALLITLIAMPMRDEKENIPCEWALMAIRGRFPATLLYDRCRGIPSGIN